MPERCVEALGKDISWVAQKSRDEFTDWRREENFGDVDSERAKKLTGGKKMKGLISWINHR
jgi:hypothetical protein